MTQLPKELCFKVIKQLDAEILLDLLKDLHFRDQFWQYFEIVTDDDEPLQYWNYDFKRSKIKDTEVTCLKIFLMEIHDFEEIDVYSLTNKFKGATSLVAISQVEKLPDGFFLDIDPSSLAEFITKNPNSTVVACLGDDCDLEEAFNYSEVNLEKLRFLEFEYLVFGDCCTLHGVLKPKRLENLYIQAQALEDVPFDLLKTVHPDTLKELSSLSLNIKSGLELERFKFDSLKEADLFGLVSLRDIQFPLLRTMNLEGKRECEVSGKLVNITAPNLETIGLLPGGADIQYELLDAPNLKSLNSYGSTIAKKDDIYDKRFLFEEIHETEYTGPILEHEWFSQVENLFSARRMNDVLRSSKLTDNLKKLAILLYTNEEVKRLNYIGELSQLEELKFIASYADASDIGRPYTAVEIPKLKTPHLKKLVIDVARGGIKTDVIAENYSTIEDLVISIYVSPAIPFLPSVSKLELPFLRKMDLSGCYDSLTEDQIGWQVPNLEELKISSHSSVDCIIDIPSASKLRKLICSITERGPDNVLIIRNESIETIKCSSFAYLTLDGNVGANVKSIRVWNGPPTPFRRFRAKDLPVIEVLEYAFYRVLNVPSIVEEVGYMNPECVRELKHLLYSDMYTEQM